MRSKQRRPWHLTDDVKKANHILTIPVDRPSRIQTPGLNTTKQPRGLSLSVRPLRRDWAPQFRRARPLNRLPPVRPAIPVAHLVGSWRASHGLGANLLHGRARPFPREGGPGAGIPAPDASTLLFFVSTHAHTYSLSLSLDAIARTRYISLSQSLSPSPWNETAAPALSPSLCHVQLLPSTLNRNDNLKTSEPPFVLPRRLVPLEYAPA